MPEMNVDFYYRVLIVTGTFFLLFLPSFRSFADWKKAQYRPEAYCRIRKETWLSQARGFPFLVILALILKGISMIPADSLRYASLTLFLILLIARGILDLPDAGVPEARDHYCRLVWIILCVLWISRILKEDIILKAEELLFISYLAGTVMMDLPALSLGLIRIFNNAAGMFLINRKLKEHDGLIIGVYGFPDFCEIFRILYYCRKVRVITVPAQRGEFLKNFRQEYSALDEVILLKIEDPERSPSLRMDAAVCGNGFRVKASGSTPVVMTGGGFEEGFWSGSADDTIYLKMISAETEGMDLVYHDEKQDVLLHTPLITAEAARAIAAALWLSPVCGQDLKETARLCQSLSLPFDCGKAVFKEGRTWISGDLKTFVPAPGIFKQGHVVIAGYRKDACEPMIDWIQEIPRVSLWIREEDVSVWAPLWSKAGKDPGAVRFYQDEAELNKSLVSQSAENDTIIVDFRIVKQWKRR